MNKPGRIGRDGEHVTNGYLVAAGFQGVTREGRRAPSLDNVAEDLTTPIETKRRGTIALPEWTRRMVAVHGPDRWGLSVVQRDARRKLHPDVLVFPTAFGAQLLYVFEQAERLGPEHAFLRDVAGGLMREA